MRPTRGFRPQTGRVNDEDQIDRNRLWLGVPRGSAEHCFGAILVRRTEPAAERDRHALQCRPVGDPGQDQLRSEQRQEPVRVADDDVIAISNQMAARIDA